MSTKKTIKIQENENPKMPLIKGANILIKEFRTPVIFLKFLTQSLYWMDLHNGKNEEDKIDSYFIKMMITEIALPWLENGAKSTEVMASGLKELYDFCGYQGYHKYVSSIVLGFMINIEDSVSRDFLRKYFIMFATMYEIGNFIAEYEMELCKREKAKIGKAA